jgi:HAD superfamily hydrolase (TIGR01509 family)
MIKAILIDLDGLLVNSEELYLKANKVYFKDFGFEFTEEHHKKGTGKKFDQWIKTIVPESIVSKSGEEILKERNKIFFNLVRKDLKLMEGAEHFLKLAKNQFKTALVTSSKKDYVNLVFEILHIKKYFDLVITGETVVYGKPDPECYLKAAKSLGVSSAECVVVEDAPSGIISGKNANMKVIAVPSFFIKNSPEVKKANIILNSLAEITLKELQSTK